MKIFKSILVMIFFVSCSNEQINQQELNESKVVTDIIFYKTPEPLEVGDRAPNFVMHPSSDNEIQLRDLRGKVLLIEFSLKDCVPCKLAEPNLVQVVKDNKGANFEFIKVMVNYNDLDEFLEIAYSINDSFVVWEPITADHKLSALYDVRAYPYAIIVDQAGYIYEVVSPQDPKLSSKINDLIF